jgi:hypothetical protein
MSESALPDAFADLVEHIAWALPSETARSKRRRESGLECAQAFYDAMAPRMVAVLQHLDRFPLDRMAGQDLRLFQLCLAFAEVAPFVEQYRRVIVVEGFDEARFDVLHDRSVET